jgi:hypothetical protein
LLLLVLWTTERDSPIWAAVGPQMRGNLVMWGWVTYFNCRRRELHSATCFGNIRSIRHQGHSYNHFWHAFECSHQQLASALPTITPKCNLVQKCCRYLWSPNSKTLVPRWSSSNRCLMIDLIPICIVLRVTYMLAIILASNVSKAGRYLGNSPQS